MLDHLNFQYTVIMFFFKYMIFVVLLRTQVGQQGRCVLSVCTVLMQRPGVSSYNLAV